MRPAFVLLAGLAFVTTNVSADEPTLHPWILVEGKHWRVDGGLGEDPAVTDAAEGTRGPCPAGMVEVSGQAKVDGPQNIELLQETVCTTWIRREFPQRCGVFDEAGWRKLLPELSVRRMHFCIDRFEYPNRRGANPIIFVTWYEAKALCARANERLCTEDEWTFACEGEDALPYPYGFQRDDTACVIDREHRAFDEEHFRQRDSVVAMRELDRLWQGEASGTRPRCKSPFGVYDQTGNVDEWTVSTHAGGYPSILKGGYWGRIRARCRPSTRAHGETFAFYQQGFRCCAAAPAAAAPAAD